MASINSHLLKVPESDLYHYTTIKGFMGIVDSEQMWATDLQYINDTKELVYAGDLVNEVIFKNMKTHENFELLYLVGVTQINEIRSLDTSSASSGKLPRVDLAHHMLLGL